MAKDLTFAEKTVEKIIAKIAKYLQSTGFSMLH